MKQGRGKHGREASERARERGARSGHARLPHLIPLGVLEEAAIATAVSGRFRRVIIARRHGHLAPGQPSAPAGASSAAGPSVGGVRTECAIFLHHLTSSGQTARARRGERRGAHGNARARRRRTLLDAPGQLAPCAYQRTACRRRQGAGRRRQPAACCRYPSIYCGRTSGRWRALAAARSCQGRVRGQRKGRVRNRILRVLGLVDAGGVLLCCCVPHAVCTCFWCLRSQRVSRRPRAQPPSHNTRSLGSTGASPRIRMAHMRLIHGSVPRASRPASPRI
jgi:hypothetical protein